MNKIYSDKKNNWLRPWNIEKFDNLYDRDERFFGILIKGVLSWLTSNLVLYNKPITHFIFNTGSSYMYIESDGYKFSMVETSGEDQMYMKMPRCVIEITDINIPTEELSSSHSRGVYERRDGNDIKGYNAEMRRLPIELTINAHYVLSNFNESIILIEEIINNVCWQQYFNIVYLGQVINCSIEIDNNFRIEFNKIDMESRDTNQKNIEIVYKVCSNYPCIDERTEIENQFVIESFKTQSSLFTQIIDNVTDTEERTSDNFPKENIDNSFNITPEQNSIPSPIGGNSTYSPNGNVDNGTGNILAYVNEDLIKVKFDELKNIKH